jgi:hypothetical protein
MNTKLRREKNYFMNFTVVTYFLSTRSVLSSWSELSLNASFLIFDMASSYCYNILLAPMDGHKITLYDIVGAHIWKRITYYIQHQFLIAISCRKDDRVVERYASIQHIS